MAVHGLRQARLEWVPLIACCHETMVKCEVAVSGTERMIFVAGNERIDRTLRKKARALGYDLVP